MGGSDLQLLGCSRSSCSSSYSSKCSGPGAGNVHLGFNWPSGNGLMLCLGGVCCQAPVSIEDNLKFGVDNEAESVFHVTLQEIVTVQDTLFPEHGSMSVLVIVADYVQHAVHCAAQVCCAELGFKLIFFHYYPGSNTFIQPGVWLWDSGCIISLYVRQGATNPVQPLFG